MKYPVAIIGTGNIGTDLLLKITNTSEVLEVAAFIGIDSDSDGIARARQLGIPVSHGGVEGLVNMPGFSEIKIVFDASSAKAHQHHYDILKAHGKHMIDLTPAAIGPYTVPLVNGDRHLDADNINMVTCGGQATIPIVAAIHDVTRVHYAEIVASIASKSAGPGTRANIDEFTETTASAIEAVGGARRGKAIIVLNPAEPPMIMRDTVFCLCAENKEREIVKAVEQRVAEVQRYVPGYRLKQAVQFEWLGGNQPLYIPEMDEKFTGAKVSVFLEVEGAGHYLPKYAGNLDIMTSAAMVAAERKVTRVGGTP